ncbi:putative reverse transcriptase domain-containing protein [Tanacetum coccineum]
MLTARKRVHPFPARIPANRRRFHSSSSPSPPDHSPAALSPIQAELLPPCKRLRGSPSAHHRETSIEDNIKTGYAASVEDYSRTGIESNVEAIIEATAYPSRQWMEEVKEETRTLTSRLETTEVERIILHDSVRSLEISELTLRDSLRIMPATRSEMTPEAIEEVIAQRVAEALETYEANRNVRNLVKNEEDNGNGNGGRNNNRHGNGNGGGNRNGNGGGNVNGNGNKNDRNGNNGDNAGGAMQAARECTYKEFLNCQPLNFKGTEGAVGLTSLQNGAVTWWNPFKRIVGTDAAYAMTWKEIIKLMTQMVPEEKDKIERFIWGLLDSIQGNVTSFAPTRFQDAARMASSLMDQKVHAITTRQADNKRKWENHSRDNHVHQQPFKRSNVARHCKTPISTTNQRAPLVNPKTTMTCYECGKQGHYCSDCPNLKNQNGGDQARNGEAIGRHYSLRGRGEANQNPNVVTVVIEQRVKDTQKACILELKRRNYEDTILTTYTLYPSRKIWHISSTFRNYKTVDGCTKNDLWDYWTREDDEEVITDDELSNLRDGTLIEEYDIAQIFRIDTDIFHFEMPLCEAFKEFNCLLKIDVDVLTNDIPGFKTYDEYKDAWIYEWNKDVPWVANMPWLDYGPWMEPSDDSEHICKPFCFKNGHPKWPTYN